MRPSANARKLSSPGPLTPPPLRRDSPVSNRLATAASSSSLPTSFSPMNDGLGSGFGGGGFDEFGAASDENDTDEEDEEDEEDSDGGSSSSLSGPSPEALRRIARNAARLHAAALGGAAVPDVSRALALPCRLLALPRSFRVAIVDADVSEIVGRTNQSDTVGQTNQSDLAKASSVRGWMRTGAAARAYAAAVLEGCGRCVRAMGEPTLAALAGCRDLRTLAPRLHASLVRELGLCRVATLGGAGVHAIFRGSGSIGVMLPAPLMAAAGPLPPLKGGGGAVGGGRLWRSGKHAGGVQEQGEGSRRAVRADPGDRGFQPGRGRVARREGAGFVVRRQGRKHPLVRGADGVEAGPGGGGGRG